MVAFDVETTGLDCKTDRIVELGYTIFENGVHKETNCFRLNPTIRIGAEASKINGITDKDVANCPTFKDKINEIKQIFSKDSVYMAFNAQFDIGFIKEEFKRCGEDIVFNSNEVIDPLKFYKNTVSNNKLTTLYKVFVGGELKKAHSASADTQAMLDVFFNMLEKFQIEPTHKTVASVCNPSADIKKSSSPCKSGHLIYDEKNNVIVKFGKHIDKLLIDAVKDDRYYNYVTTTDFPQDVKDLFKMAKEGKLSTAK